MGKHVAYYRVSTKRQGFDGLGMDAQKHAVKAMLGGAPLVGEFSEVETGKHAERPELAKALACCRKHKARLLIAKLDRLARNAAFLLSLRDSGVDFVAADMPHADKFTVGVMALLAEKERDMIAQRTREALAAAKRRGIKLGNPKLAVARRRALVGAAKRRQAFANQLAPVVNEIRSKGKVEGLREIADALNARGFKSLNGGSFTRRTVRRLLNRIAG